MVQAYSKCLYLIYFKTNQLTVSNITLLQDKAILLKLLPFAFSLLFVIQLIPLAIFNGVREFNPITLWSSTFLFIVGAVFLIDFLRNYIDAKSHGGAKGASIIFLIMAIATWGYGIANISGFHNPFDLAGQDTAFNIFLIILLVASTIVLYLGLHPELRHKHTLSKGIRQNKVF